MKEIKNRWVGLAIWLALLAAVWWVGERFGWKHPKQAYEYHAWLVLFGIAGVLACIFSGNDRQ